jgi:hypothetical protein
MSTSTSRTPSLRRHKPSGQAVVTLDGKDQYLGVWPTGLKKAPPGARAAYDRLLSEWLSNGRRLPGPATAEQSPFTVNDLILAFWRHAEEHYRHEDGGNTNELSDYRYSLRPLRQLYGETPVVQFSP